MTKKNEFNEIINNNQINQLCKKKIDMYKKKWIL